jgi:hypothetical protein
MYGDADLLLNESKPKKSINLFGSQKVIGEAEFGTKLDNFAEH